MEIIATVTIASSLKSANNPDAWWRSIYEPLKRWNNRGKVVMLYGVLSTILFSAPQFLSLPMHDYSVSFQEWWLIIWRFLLSPLTFETNGFLGLWYL